MQNDGISFETAHFCKQVTSTLKKGIREVN